MAALNDWEAVYAEQLPRVYNYFRVRTPDVGLAEDLTSATFERAWRARNGYRTDRGGIGTWLFAIARNVSASHYRRPAARELPLDGAEEPGHTPALDDALQRREDVARLRELVGRLPANDRELIALKYGAELTNREIAKLTGLRESNVGTRLHRIVQRLRAAWEKRER
jgi:RNA polymerase sigma-70 factor (ECF subfamily)